MNTGGVVYAFFGPGAESRLTNQLRTDPLAATRERVRQALGSDGYAEMAGPLHENFEVYLNRRPVEMDIEDLRPGLLNDVAAWAASEIAGEPEQALQVQANVPPQGAVKLLT
jgi:hypothetical protein